MRARTRSLTVISAGEYTLIVSSFEPRQHGTYELTLKSMRAFELDLLPAEGAGMYTKTIRGAWYAYSCSWRLGFYCNIVRRRQEDSAGLPGLGRYHSNTSIKVTVPTSMYIMYAVETLCVRH